MPTFKVKVKWNKEIFSDIELSTEEPPIVLKQRLFALTGVQTDRQRLMVKGSTLKDDDWNNIQIKDGMTLLLMGTTEKLPEPPKQQIVFMDSFKELNKNLEIIKNGLNERASEGLLSMETVEQMSSAINSLIESMANVDNSRNFYKTGGFEVLPPLLESNSKILRAKACELLAEVVQNQTECQKYAMESHLLDILVKLLNTDPNETVRIKSLYAISCLIRGNDSAEHLFESKHNGLSLLLKVFDSTNPLSKDNKLRIKASFLMSSLCRKQSVCHSLHGLGVLTQLVGSLRGEHDSTHEYLLGALLALVSNHEPSRQDCQRPDWGLKNFLNQRIEDLKERPEFLEELDYCKQLLELLFSDKDLPLS